MRRFFLLCGTLSLAWLSPLVANAESTTTYQYDALGRLVTATYSNGSVITYSYDAAGNRTQVVITAGTAPAVKVVVLPLLGGLVVPVP